MNERDSESKLKQGMVRQADQNNPSWRVLITHAVWNTTNMRDS